MKGKVLFIDSVHPILEEQLKSAGFEVDLHFKTPLADLIPILSEYTGLVIRSRITLDSAFFNHTPNLRFVARSGSGLENIDLEAAAHRGVKVYSSPEGNKNAVGEHAIAMLLALFNKIIQADTQVRSGLWLREENRGIELTGKTVGIIGYGHMGSSFAKKISGFDCEVIAYDKYLTTFPSSFAAQVSLEDIYAKSDIVSIHLPLGAETKYYANVDFFNSFKKPIYFINTSRGQQVKTEDLVHAMESNRVLGACLDVLEFEKKSLEGLDISTFPESLKYLMNSDRVILSPHVAGWTVESYIKLSSVLGEKIIKDFS